MPLISYADAPTIDMHDLTARPMAVPSRGSTELAMWYLTVQPGINGEAHTVDHEEVFVVQSGELVGELAGEPVTVTAGDAFLVPAGVLFSLRNKGTEPVTALVCTIAGVTASLNGKTVVPAWSK